jgi:hypothetical protein
MGSAMTGGMAGKLPGSSYNDRNILRRYRTWPSQPRLIGLGAEKSWVAGPSPAMTKGKFRACSSGLAPVGPRPAMTEGKFCARSSELTPMGQARP